MDDHEKQLVAWLRSRRSFHEEELSDYLAECGAPQHLLYDAAHLGWIARDRRSLEDMATGVESPRWLVTDRLFGLARSLEGKGDCHADPPPGRKTEPIPAELWDQLVSSVLCEHHGYADGQLRDDQPLASKTLTARVAREVQREARTVSPRVSEALARLFPLPDQRQRKPEEAYQFYCRQGKLLNWFLRRFDDGRAFGTADSRASWRDGRERVG